MSLNHITSSPKEPEVFFVGATSPLSHSIYFKKLYPTHTMILADHRGNVFSELSWQWATYDNEGKKNGIAGETYKFKPYFSAEFQEDRVLRQVTVPSNFHELQNEFREEIINKSKEAQEAYQDGFEVYNRYLDRICDASITVDFMSKEKYLAICTERVELFEKMKKQTEIYQAEYKEQKKVFEQQQQQFSEMQQRNKAQESAEARAALSGFVAGLAQAFNSYEHPKMPMPAPTAYTRKSYSQSSGASYQPYYEESDCNGPVVNGRCLGTINPAATAGKCYGKMLNGECIGATLK